MARGPEYVKVMNPFVLLLLLAVALTACKRHETAAAAAGSPADPAASTAAQTEAVPGAPTQVPTETVVVPESADMNATLDQLSTELRVYVSSTRSRPKDFQDFVARAHVQAPPPPAGKNYAIAAGKVVLVKQ
jgi:hypothetical protein